jgi:hypothetical protein
MNKLILYFVIVFFVGISCDKDEIGTGQADKFIKYYGGLAADHGNDVKQLPDGGYFIVGTITVGDNETDIFTLITDKYGNSVSDLKTFDGNNLNDKISRMQLLDDGGAVAIGTFQRTLANNDIWLLRFNNRGDTIWTRKFGKSYGDDEGYNLIINKSNEIIAVGYTDSLTSGGIHNKQIWMHSIGLDGENIFATEKRHGFLDLDEVANCVLEVDDEYILIGSENPKNSSRNIFIKKTNSVGNINSSSQIASDDDDQGNMITILPDGNFLILSTKTNISTHNSDIVLIEIDGSFKDNKPLEILGEKILDDGENESASCFIYKNNQVHILGTTIESRTDTRILLIITDESGNNPQYFRYGFKNIAMEGFGMDYTSDGGYIFTGSNLVLFKIKDSGEL